MAQKPFEETRRALEHALRAFRHEIGLGGRELGLDQVLGAPAARQEKGRWSAKARSRDQFEAAMRKFG